MIKKTVTISSPSHLSLRREQLTIHNKESDLTASVPMEEIGYLILEHEQITLTLPLLQACVEENVAMVVCDAHHLPSGLLHSLSSHHLQGMRLREQLEAAKPLSKGLWKQIIVSKIRNQSAVLEHQGCDNTQLKRWATEVKSNDTDNREGLAAREYWQQLMGPSFVRSREGPSPNGLLNYAYTLLRAATCRAIIGSGLSPDIGLFHHNQYNPFPLADDLMEPYRPIVDQMVLALIAEGVRDLNPYSKRYLRQLLTIDVVIENRLHPLQLALGITSSSLVKCYTKQQKHLQLPSVPSPT